MHGYPKWVSRRKRNILLGLGLITAGAVIGVGWIVKPLIDRGFFETATPDKYVAGREANLKAIHNALMLYHDSEGQFPAANGWLDAIRPRMQTNKMTAQEAETKIIRPDLAGKPGAFGYALNVAAAEKYKDDVGRTSTVLVYESIDERANAAGDPELSAGRLGITIEGKLVP